VAPRTTVASPTRVISAGSMPGLTRFIVTLAMIVLPIRP